MNGRPDSSHAGKLVARGTAQRTRDSSTHAGQLNARGTARRTRDSSTHAGQLDARGTARRTRDSSTHAGQLDARGTARRTRDSSTHAGQLDARGTIPTEDNSHRGQFPPRIIPTEDNSTAQRYSAMSSAQQMSKYNSPRMFTLGQMTSVFLVDEPVDRQLTENIMRDEEKIICSHKKYCLK